MAIASEIAKRLGGHRSGAGYLCHCPVPNHGKGRGDRLPSLSIADGKSGLLLNCFAGCNRRDIFDELRRQGLLEERGTLEKPLLLRRPALAPAPSRSGAEGLAAWRCAAGLSGTLGEGYFCSRGITAQPPSLRFLDAAKHVTGRIFPALVAAVQAPDRRITAVQLTFLDPRGDRKAQVPKPRWTYGALGLGAVRLGPAGDTLGLAEGIETGLSAMQIFAIPVWCSIGAGRMHRVGIPDTVRELHIFADNDGPGREAAERTAAAHRYRRVIIHHPEPGFGDWNDALAQNESAA